MPRTSHRRSGVPRLYLLLALCLLAVVLVATRGPLAGLVLRAAAPAAALRASLPLSALTAQFAQKAALEQENLSLRLALASTTLALADRNALYQENLDLKARLNRNGSEQRTLAGVIMRPPGTPYDTLLVDAGSAQGIAPGDLVAAAGSTVIGDVEQVYPTTARVELFSSPGMSYQALLLHAGASVPVSLEGQGGGSMMGQLPAGTAATPGDAVVLPGIASPFVGTLSRVDAPSGESFETVYLHEPVNLFELQFVEVIHSHAQ